jgi:hypothetical protein
MNNLLFSEGFVLITHTLQPHPHPHTYPSDTASSEANLLSPEVHNTSSKPVNCCQSPKPIRLLKILISLLNGAKQHYDIAPPLSSVYI